MPVNLDGSWSASSSSSPCRYDDLATLVADYISWRKRSGEPRPITARGVHRLTELAFYASLGQEEGRTPLFRFFAGAPQDGPRVAFDPPIKIDPKAIRRLAPSLRGINDALWIREEGENFRSDGIVSVVEDRCTTPACIFNSAFDQIKPGLLMRVMGPGHLRATVGGTWEWKAGTLRELRHFSSVGVIRGWHHDLKTAILGQLSRDEWEGILLGMAIRNTWSFIIESVVDAGHGGAFIIIPENCQRAITLKYPTSASLFDYLKDFWGQFSGHKRDIGSPAESWEMKATDPHLASVAEHRLRSFVQTVAELANVDGCVVFDRQLRLKGFGGEIQVEGSPHRDLVSYRGFFLRGEEIAREKKERKFQLWNEPCADLEARTKDTVDVKERGTRHRSAFRLCEKVPGTIGFVISQDRALSVFFGDDQGHVWVWESLDASARPIDRA